MRNHNKVALFQGKDKELFRDRKEFKGSILKQLEDVYQFIDLVNKSRSANITCVLATQSLSDLDFAVDSAFREQIIENTNNYLVLRQNSATNAEAWASVLGTRQSMEVTYQIEQQQRRTSTTGLGSARRVREFLYHPDEIKDLKTGEAFFS